MTIQELKHQIETKSVTSDLIIFKDTENGFISNQYIDAISKITGKSIEYHDTPEDFVYNEDSIFSMHTPQDLDVLGVVKSEVYIWANVNVAKLTNVIIVVSKFEDKNLEKQLEDYIVAVPKIQDWQIKDYACSLLTGVPQNNIENLLKLCGTNLFRLQSEMDKLLLFSKDEQKYVYEDLVRDDAFSDMSEYSIFNLTNAITAKDYKTLLNVYRQLDKIDVNEFGLLTILIKNFKNILMVQLNQTPTPENTGLDGKQLWVIKKIPKVFSPTQLVNIYEALLSIDKQIKSGELPTELAIDYMLIKILSA